MRRSVTSRTPCVCRKSVLFEVRHRGQQTHLGLGVPVALDLGVELDEKLGAALSPGLSQTRLIQKEIDAEVGIFNDGLVGDGEAADA